MRFENITLKLGDRFVLQQFSLSLETGRITCIMGRSGLGKTTLLRLAARLQQPDHGKLIATKHEAVGYVFQETRLLPWKSVLDNVQWVLKDRMDHASGRRAAQDMLEAVGLGAVTTALPYELSGGMRQRVAIARAFALKPSLLLLDEPFQSLDISNRRLMQQLLVRQWPELRQTIVFVTHDLDEALAVGQHIVLLDESPAQVAMYISAEWRSDGSWFFQEEHIAALKHRIYSTHIEGSGKHEISRVTNELGRHDGV